GTNPPAIATAAAYRAILAASVIATVATSTMSNAPPRRWRSAVLPGKDKRHGIARSDNTDAMRKSRAVLPVVDPVPNALAQVEILQAYRARHFYGLMELPGRDLYARPGLAVDDRHLHDARDPVARTAATPTPQPHGLRSSLKPWRCTGVNRKVDRVL
ncbi:hypothetical protein, partial [Gemmatimonas sp.]|uniref:hypothetical protein n=1 Tax=Gemmatimonas sp. TaxID=1962908 RepID=UPI00286AE02B